jgi:hypothetical protein
MKDASNRAWRPGNTARLANSAHGRACMVRRR